ncbi:MAG: hypothetical protein H6721_01240 [Sandaracinus sp.]|nr:hypothetical protein [Sandaracinus sp.]MCB9630767.1 hypothetical protein [Sandaracinus sp.]
MYQLRDALIQAFMSRMQGVDHTAATYAADVVLQVLQQQGIPLQPPHQGASPSSIPGKSGPMGGVPPEKAGMAKTPGYDKAGYHGDKGAAPVDKGGYGKAAPPMDKGGYAKAPDPGYGKAPDPGYGKGAPPMDKGGYPDKGGFKK